MSLPKNYLTPLREALAEAGHPEDAEQMQRYLKDQFAFFGVKAPARRVIQRDFLKEEGKPAPEDLPQLLRLCFAEEERELHYFAIEMLYPKSTLNKLTPAFLPTLQEALTTKSWWDTVDSLATKVAGSLAMRYPEAREEIAGWQTHENLWLRRTAILFQLKYKEKTDEKLLFSICEKLAPEREFFIAKAIGWALRQHARTAPEAVPEFVAENAQILAPLSKREALKHF
jgi:3-methyladenine DNA glycosylase AlkD